MNIVSGNAPFLRRSRSTGDIMRELLIGLAVIFIAAVVYNFTLGVRYGLKTIGIMAVSILFTLISDLIAGSLRYNKNKDGKYEDFMIDFMKHNFSMVTAVIFALTIPVGTPVYVIAIGSIFATLIVKHAFGGFGSNIFNPAALGRLFLALTFGNQLKAYFPGDLSIGGMNAGVTITGQFAGEGIKFITGSLANTNVSMLDLWLGNYSGAIGETFTLLILLVGAVLAAREVINWRTPVFLFGTVLLSSIAIGLVTGVNVGEYILLQFGLGGLVFGAIFMFTDPVSSPTSNYGKALIGILGGLVNLLIRIAGSYPEGTAFSIAIINVLSPMIDRLIDGRTDIKLWKPSVVSGVLVAVSVGLLTGVSAAKAPRQPNGPAQPEVEPFVEYSGSYASPDPTGHGSGFTVNVTVRLNEYYHIIEIEHNALAVPASYLSESEKDQLITYYTSLSVADFKLLAAPQVDDEAGTTIGSQSGEHIIPGKIYSSRALYEAINDALKTIDVYQGEDTDFPSEVATEEMTIKVDVYVDSVAEKIKTLDILEGGSTQNWKSTWDEALPEVLAKYHDLDVDTFLSYTSPIELYGSDPFITGVSYSPRRLFAAVQNALEGYGV